MNRLMNGEDVVAESDDHIKYDVAQHGWIVSDAVFVDPTKSMHVIAIGSPTVGAIAFQRLFTVEERIKARELRASDQKLDDFWRQIEDPRTDVVVMALPSIQDDIEYTLLAVKEAGLEIDVAARKAAILTGEVQ